jgi:phosphodiesterase/alkaline phosphatase D-like protein
MRHTLPFALPAVVFALGCASNSVTHGPILGRPGPHEAGVWVRTEKPGPFRVRYGTDPDRLDQYSPAGETRLERDNTGWVHLRGLKAAAKYHYRVVLPGPLGERDGPGGSFRTLPDSNELKTELNPKGLFNFRFEFACGNNQTPGQGAGSALPAFKTMLDKLEDHIDFAVLNGDWLYEAVRDYTPAQWRAQVGVTEAQTPGVVSIAPTICGVWENYKLYLSRGAHLAAWHRRMPSLFTFDDHEILNDVWGAGSPGLVDRRAVFRDIGVQAWYDYIGWSNPVPHAQGIHFGRAQLKAGSDVLTDPEADFTKLDPAQAATLHVHWNLPTAGVNDNALDKQPPGEKNAGVYQIVKVLDARRLQIAPAAAADSTAAYSVGRLSHFRYRVGNCELIMLDTRTHRQMHDVKQPDKPGVSMLGARQKQWLKDLMTSSDAEFFFVFSSVNFMVPHVGGGAVRSENKDDAWTVFLAEREELIQFWDALGKPVFVLTGDLHNSFAIRITDRVWEFASGPHNSNNHWAADEGDRPANGTFRYGPRPCEIRWSTWFSRDIPRENLQHPTYCVVQVNNVFNNPLRLGETRWIPFPVPQVVFQYYDGRTGELRYAEAIPATRPAGRAP